MLVINSHIEIGKFTFDYLHEVEVTNSWKNLTDTAIIKLPRKLVDKQGKLLQDIAKRSDTVQIQLGYDDNLNTVFTGYVAYTKATTPVEYHLENEMFKHKQKSVQVKSWQKATVDTVMQHLGITNYETFGSIDLGAFQIDDKIKNEAGVFDKIKQQYGISFFYRRGKLVIGKPYDINTAKTHNFSFQHNIISNDLEYKRKDEVAIKVKAISNFDNGKKETVELGDADGETHTLNFYNLNKASLKANAEAEMEKLKYDGYRGKFTTFGLPKVEVGDIANILDEEYTEREGKFFIDEVKTTCSVSGGLRQEITLGFKANK